MLPPVRPTAHSIRTIDRARAGGAATIGRRIRATAALAAVAALVLSGCSSPASSGANGSGSGTDGSGSSASSAPDPAVAESRTWTGDIVLNGSPVAIELDGAAAPQAVASFVTLAADGFFDGTTCHRLTTAGIFVLQCGDPTATGSGGPGYSYGPIENAPASDVYPAGTLAMARRGNDAASMGSQFFIVYDESQIPSDSAGGYTVLGRVTDGLDVVLGIADAGVAGGGRDGAPAEPADIDSVSVE